MEGNNNRLSKGEKVILAIALYNYLNDFDEEEEKEEEVIHDNGWGDDTFY